MELPNQHFQDFPIEFKEINPSDFPEFEIENNNEKIIIRLNEGFINDDFQSKIALRHKNTVVVNAAVGQGKSTAIINTIKRYYDEHPDTLIIVVAPYVSLVKQYCDDIGKPRLNIPESQIFNYGKIGREFNIDYKTKRIHVATVNALLGNPGDNAFKNSDEKRQYLNTLINHCAVNNLKVVFIYDEIHDAIQNFKEEFIFNLWKWKGVILKNYILSATYNEASKVVIEYLSELTDKKIQIIESRRTVFPRNQSKLYLHYNPAQSYKASNPELVQIVKNLIKSDKKIDILCYSRKLAKDIMNEENEIGKLLIDKYEEINDCTSELEDNSRQGNEEPKNVYDNGKCNVGTNFKTGVSIMKSNHAFIIIMPPEGTKTTFTNYFGIFSDGTNSVIQALARQRTPEEIHIILPEPYKFNYSSLLNAGCNEHQISIFKKFYDEVASSKTNTVDYLKLNAQDEIIQRFYNQELYGNVSNEIEHINSLERTNLAPLRYPPYKQFKLDKGEEYLSSKFFFFGKDLSSYVTYCAFTNQFVNCRLIGLNTKPVLYFEEGKIQRNLIRYFEEYFKDEENLMPYFSFNHFYTETRAKFFSSFKLKIKINGGWDEIKPYSKDFEKQLISFCANQFFKSNYYYSGTTTTNGLRDIEYTRDKYFLECISIANTLDIEEVNYSAEQKNKIKAYKNLYSIRNLLIDKISIRTRGSENYNYLPLNLLEGFINSTEKNLFEDTITLLIESDSFIKNDVFNFRRNLISDNQEKNLDSFYNALIKDFFEIESQKRIQINENLVRVYKISHIKELPDHFRVIDTMRLDPLIDFANKEYGSWEIYQETLNRLLAEAGY